MFLKRYVHVPEYTPSPMGNAGLHFRVPLGAVNMSGALYAVLVFREHSYSSAVIKSSSPEKVTPPSHPSQPPPPHSSPQPEGSDVTARMH